MKIINENDSIQKGAVSNVLDSMSREDTWGELGAIAHLSEHASSYWKKRELYRSYFRSSNIVHFTISSDLKFWKRKIGQIGHYCFRLLGQGQPFPTPSALAAPLLYFNRKIGQIGSPVREYLLFGVGWFSKIYQNNLWLIPNSKLVFVV